MAALEALFGRKRSGIVSVTLPGGRDAKIEIKKCHSAGGSAVASVIKDGGDDPDVTHGAEIVAEISLTDSAGMIEIDGGEGVGTVTKPGLGLELERPAINPTPKRMIQENLTKIAGSLLEKKGVRVVISVPRGRELALKTDNPRLGIVGGISILGTSGIVHPFSTAAFAAAIRQNIDVSVAMGDKIIALSTGGRSEEFAKRIVDLPDHSFVQMGDFAGYAIKQCAEKGIEKALIVGFIGKFSKMAAGTKQTHVKGSKVDMNLLAELASKAGARAGIIQRIKTANTARHVQEIISEDERDGDFFEAVCARVHLRMNQHAQGRVPIEVILFDFDGGILARYPGESAPNPGSLRCSSAIPMAERHIPNAKRQMRSSTERI